MSVQNGSRHETFPTPRTNVWPFTGVVTFVNDQRGSLCKSFAALVARVFSLACVRDVMSPEEGLARETLAAYLAGVRLFPGVRSIVYLEAFRRF